MNTSCYPLHFIAQLANHDSVCEDKRNAEMRNKEENKFHRPQAQRLNAQNTAWKKSHQYSEEKRF